MRIIAISNNKGGVGKTTSTVNIAAALQILGKKVLVIDMDHQAQSTYHLGVQSNKLKRSIYDVLKGELPFRDIMIDRNGMHLLPSSPDLKGLEFLPIPAKEFLLPSGWPGVPRRRRPSFPCSGGRASRRQVH